MNARVPMSKPALRKTVSKRLASIGHSDLRKQSLSIGQHLRQLPAYQSAVTVAFYMHMDTSEVQTDGIIASAFEDCKRVFLPQIVAQPLQDSLFQGQKTHLRMLEVPSMEDVLKLEPQGKYKLKEPQSGKNCLDVDSGETGLDLVILPGVAFTREGARLGHGAAYYDSFIDEHRAKVGRDPRFLVGLALREQLIDEVPMEDHDRWLHAVVSPDAVYTQT